MFNNYFSLIETDGDKELAEQLYYDYRNRMYKVAYGYLKNMTRAEDAVSDGFEKICMNIKIFRGLDCNKTQGLIVIYVKHICLNMLKRDKIIEFHELEDDYKGIGSDAIDTIINDENYRRIVDIVESLEEKYKEIFRLKYFIGFRDNEIAETLDITPTNVRVRLFRAKGKVKQLLKEADNNAYQLE